MADNTNQVIVRFEDDSENSVSLATALALMTITRASSLEAFIQQSLAAYRENMEIAFPTDDIVSTSEHWTEIARLYPNGLQLKSTFYEQQESKTNIGGEYTLQDLMSDVTEENKHDRIDFGKPVGREKF